MPCLVLAALAVALLVQEPRQRQQPRQEPQRPSVAMGDSPGMAEPKMASLLVPSGNLT